MSVETSQDENGNGRILIVEDENLISLLLETTLSDAGYQIAGTASNLSSALEMVGQVAADAAILDLNLKGKKVYPVAEKLLAAGIPFIFATGGGHEVEGFENCPTINKPFREAELLESVARLMAKPAAKPVS